METYSKTEPFTSCHGIIKDITRQELCDKGCDRVLSLDDAAFQALIDMTELYLEGQHCWNNETLYKDVKQNNGEYIKPFLKMMYDDIWWKLKTTFNPGYIPPLTNIVLTPKISNIK